jgi:hypothetical protein
MNFYIKYYCHFVHDNFKMILSLISVAVLFLILTLETAFPKLISSGEGIVKGYHILETNTGSKTRLYVKYEVYEAIGDYSGKSIPDKGAFVKVTHLKSLFLGRDIFIFYD